MWEIGGYIELDRYHLPLLHDGAIALNSGRNALAYLMKARDIEKLWLPRFLCDSIMCVCEREGVPFGFYDMGQDFLPTEGLSSGTFSLGEGEWLYLVNFYSQLTDKQIEAYKTKYNRIIVDNAQSYFQFPIHGVDTLYTCRKYFGVADGAFLYTDTELDEDLPIDESDERMGFLLGRFERSAGEFYGDYVKNNELFKQEPIKRMSRLTENLLHGIDYVSVEQQRKDNFEYLHSKLESRNLLTVVETGTFMYPFMIENGGEIRKKLQAKKIFIPTLWPNVLEDTGEDSLEHRMAENILPLPIDQRYGREEMEYLAEEVQRCIGSRNWNGIN